MARPIEVILTEDSEAGKAGELRKAKPGYVRNFLLPKGLAVIADRFNMQAFEQRKAQLEQQAQVKREQAEKTKQIIGEESSVNLEARAGESGKLFGAVTKEKIAEAINQSYKTNLSKDNILLRNPIKETGDHKVELDFGSNIKSKIKVRVTSA
jgi:large subunit ribosomal protein L9